MKSNDVTRLVKLLGIIICFFAIIIDLLWFNSRLMMLGVNRTIIIASIYMYITGVGLYLNRKIGCILFIIAVTANLLHFMIMLSLSLIFLNSDNITLMVGLIIGLSLSIIGIVYALIRAFCILYNQFNTILQNEDNGATTDVATTKGTIDKRDDDQAK